MKRTLETSNSAEHDATEKVPRIGISTGGRASGPEPLKDVLDFTQKPEVKCITAEVKDEEALGKKHNDIQLKLIFPLLPKQDIIKCAPAPGTPMDAYKARLNEEQFAVFTTCLQDKKNIFVTGQGGAGKSFLIRSIHEYATTLGKNVFITALTGCAAMSIEGTTLHHYMGIGLGDKELKEMKKTIGRDAKERICDTDLLVIDEISMADPKYFEVCNEVLKHVRKSPKAFGGIQVLIVGDFLQLPPVGVNTFVFQTEIWKNLELECFTLRYNHRQQGDEAYAKFLARMRVGQLTKPEFDLVKTSLLGKCMPEEAIIPHVYSKNDQVLAYNTKMLDQLETEPHVFTVSGINFERLIKQVPVTEITTLKVGAKVILCKNLNVHKRMFNGRRGTVVDFVTESKVCPNVLIPRVQFLDGEEESVDIDFATWEMCKTVKVKGRYVKEVLATFVQVPLILAYAITVHKTQGMTLEAVNLNGGFFECGHAYVAFSRVKTLEGVYMGKNVNFGEIRTDKRVISYYRANNLI